jgi:tripartite-type tricarboxylate transporter receptor subunit TctC
MSLHLPPLSRHLVADIYERKCVMFSCSWASVAIAVITLLAQSAQAQTYPSKAVRLLTSASAGGGADSFVRAVSAQLGGPLGQTVTVENKASSGAQMAAVELAKAPPDGHTLLAVDNGTLVMNPAVYKKLPYDIATLAPISVIARAPLVLVASKDSGYKSAKEMLDAAKSEPGKLAYASANVGSPYHLAMEMLKVKAGLSIARVPFASEVAALKDVLAGQLPLTVVDLPSALPHVRAGKLQVLGIFSSRKSAALPDVPTFSELGFKDTEAFLWQGLMVSASTSAPIQAKLAQSLQAALNNPGLKKNLSDAGWEILASDASLMGALVATDSVVWHRFIREAKISID